MSSKPPANRRNSVVSSLDVRAAGGARRDRTDDLKLAKLALSQLSYGPVPTLRLPRRGHPSRLDLLEDSTTEWWAWKDLNFRPHAYQARALTN